MTVPSRRSERRPVDGVEAPIGPVLDDPGGLRQRAGLIAVAAIALSVVAAGIGLGSRETESDLSGSASGSASPGRSASAPSPTEIPGLGCLPVAPDDLPAFRLRSTVGEDATRGESGPVDWARVTRRAEDWPLPDARGGLPLAPSASLVLITDEFACARLAVAEYLSVSEVGAAPVPFAVGEINASLPRPHIVLAGLPIGDWIVRVGVYYETGDSGNQDRVGVERFFRVFSGSGPGVSPRIGPAVPCAPLPADAPAPALELVAGDAAPVVGADVSESGVGESGVGLLDWPVATGTFPERLEIRVSGDVCATSWQIRFLDSTSGVMNESSEENPGENPFSIAQNRIDLPNAVLGRSVVYATVNFGRDQVALAAWELTLAGPPAPAALVSGPNRARAVALPGCVGWSLSDGRSAYEHCPTTPVPADLELLTVQSDDTVRIDIPGWLVTSWWVTCGDRSPVDGTLVDDPAGCQLGGFGNGSDDAGPARFIPFPGRHVVSVWFNAIRDGDNVGAQYFIEVDARP